MKRTVGFFTFFLFLALTPARAQAEGYQYSEPVYESYEAPKESYSPPKDYYEAKDALYEGDRYDSKRLGGPLPYLSPEELSMFRAGQEAFIQTHAVKNKEYSSYLPFGLGPRFNSDSCVSCHSYPVVGGSSPPVNPLFAVANRDGAKNYVPFFLTPDGPVREARFKYIMLPNGTLSKRYDGGAYNLFVITGRPDAPGCYLKQPDFKLADKLNNLALRIPTPLFGLGVIEAISDKAILDSHAASSQARAKAGVYGRPNLSEQDGTILKFGWKAQTKSLLAFSGEAYQVEMGVTNDLFPDERELDPRCNYNPLPEDHSKYLTGYADAASDIQKFTSYMRFTAPPPFAGYDKSYAYNRGREIFGQIGCALCHTPSLPVGYSYVEAINKQKVANLWSDLLIHKMGWRLSDGIKQGSAGYDEWRTAPLWGLGQRLFFLHDGRTRSIDKAIEFHYSAGKGKIAPSEANYSVDRWNRLNDRDKQELLSFLKSL